MEVADDLAHGGRVYGGGLNKIEPKGLEAIALPAWVRERFRHLRAERTDQRGLFNEHPAEGGRGGRLFHPSVI